MMPTINAMMIVGLVSLPGMMTGQMLGGVPPVQAVMYQIVIMFLIAAGTSLGTRDDRALGLSPAVHAPTISSCPGGGACAGGSEGLMGTNFTGTRRKSANCAGAAKNTEKRAATILATICSRLAEYGGWARVVPKRGKLPCSAKNGLGSGSSNWWC